MASIAQAGLPASKKPFRDSERDEALREQFRAEWADLPAAQRVDLDETGMAHTEARAYGWSLQGEPWWGEQPGPRTPRVSLLDALHQHALIAPLVFEGTCTTALFAAYIKHCVLPVLHPGQVGDL